MLAELQDAMTAVIFGLRLFEFHRNQNNIRKNTVVFFENAPKIIILFLIYQYKI